MQLVNNYLIEKTNLLLICGFLITMGCSTMEERPNSEEVTILKEIPTTLDLGMLGTNGIVVVDKQTLIPNSNGVVAEIYLKFPEYQNGMYYRPFSEKKASGNRMEALWFTKVNELFDYKRKKPREDNNMRLGSFMLVQKKNGNFLAILPIVSKIVGNTLNVGKESFILETATFGSKSITVAAPLFSYAESKNPYEAARKVWELAKESKGVKGNFNLRSEKDYPEPFKYLGWCSWEHFREDINEEIIVKAIDDIKSSNLPIRWVLVDDGYLDQENRKLKSFGVDKHKFPNGWKPITGLKDDKIRWMGIWRNFNGYMNGVSPNNTLRSLSKHLDTVVYGERKHKVRMMSKNTFESANVFYDAMTSDTKDNGFDIIKVDFQSSNLNLNAGKENLVESVHNNNRALEENIKNKDLKLLNCMAMMNFNVFNQTHSNLIRSSVDYKTNVDRIDLTIVQNFTNAFWLGHVHWVDQDMFHTSYKETARLMAASRAISGGPIYLSDETKNIDDTHLTPLVYDDGEIIRTLAPGVPLPESLLSDPFTDKKAFKVIAPLKNKSAAVMAVNLNRETIINTSISPKDYPNAAGMLQPFEGLWILPEDGVLLFDCYKKTAKPLIEEFQFQLKTREERLFQLSPIIKGWSVVGRSDKYLPAATVEVKSISENAMTLIMKETGPLTLWSKHGMPKLNGLSFESLGNHLYIMDMSDKAVDNNLEITR